MFNGDLGVITGLDMEGAEPTLAFDGRAVKCTTWTRSGSDDLGIADGRRLLLGDGLQIPDGSAHQVVAQAGGSAAYWS